MSVVVVLLLAACAAAAGSGFAGWLLPGRRWLERLAALLGAIALGLALVAWILRFREAGHLPLFGTWEAALSLALASLTVPALSSRLRAAALWPVGAAIALLLLAHGRRFDTGVFPLTISERSLVVDAHALLAWAAFAALLANFGLALHRIVRREPGLDDAVLARSLSVGFFLHSAMLVSGSLYEFLLFGRAWSFDPVETLGIVVWMTYGSLLHLHLFAGWGGPRLARWCIAAFALLVVSYRGIAHFPPDSSWHIFDIDLRSHRLRGP